eukprot:gene16735-19893_t
MSSRFPQRAASTRKRTLTVSLYFHHLATAHSTRVDMASNAVYVVDSDATLALISPPNMWREGGMPIVFSVANLIPSEPLALRFYGLTAGATTAYEEVTDGLVRVIAPDQLEIVSSPTYSATPNSSPYQWTVEVSVVQKGQESNKVPLVYYGLSIGAVAPSQVWRVHGGAISVPLLSPTINAFPATMTFTWGTHSITNDAQVSSDGRTITIPSFSDFSFDTNLVNSQSVGVQVKVGSIVSNSQLLTVVGPRVTGVTPNKGHSVGGTQIVVSGSNLVQVGQTPKVSIISGSNQHECTISKTTLPTDQSITCTTTDMPLSTGSSYLAHLNVTVAPGLFIIIKDYFNIIFPTLTEPSDDISYFGNRAITFSIANCRNNPTDGIPTILVGGEPCTNVAFESPTSCKITATIPRLRPTIDLSPEEKEQQFPISITLASGQRVKIIRDAKISISYPVIFNSVKTSPFTPSLGHADTKTNIQISGENFPITLPAGESIVILVDKQACVTPTVVSAFLMTCEVPISSIMDTDTALVKDVDVSVTIGDLPITIDGSDKFTYYRHSITSLETTPASGDAQTEIYLKITGTNLRQVRSIVMGDITINIPIPSSSSLSTHSDTSLVFKTTPYPVAKLTAPSFSLTTPIVAIAGTMQSKNPNNVVFTFYTPNIDTNPLTALNLGTTELNIKGVNLLDVVSVTINSIPCILGTSTADVIKCSYTPAIGAVDSTKPIEVKFPTTTFSTLSLKLVVPTITQIPATVASTVSTIISIHTTNFMGYIPTIFIGGIVCPLIEPVTTVDILQCRTSPSLVANPVAPITFSINKGLTYTSPKTINVFATTITAASILTSPPLATGSIILTGTFYPVGYLPTVVTVWIGLSQCVITSLLAATSLTCTIPPQPAGSYSIFVKVDGQTSPPFATQFKYVGPSIAFIAPSQGPKLKEYLVVTVFGANFNAPLQVTIGTLPCTPPTGATALVAEPSPAVPANLPPQMIRCIKPAETTIGLRSVVVTSGAVRSGDNVQFTQVGLSCLSSYASSDLHDAHNYETDWWFTYKIRKQNGNAPNYLYYDPVKKNLAHHTEIYSMGSGITATFDQIDHSKGTDNSYNFMFYNDQVEKTTSPKWFKDSDKGHLKGFVIWEYDAANVPHGIHVMHSQSSLPLDAPYMLGAGNFHVHPPTSTTTWRNWMNTESKENINQFMFCYRFSNLDSVVDYVERNYAKVIARRVPTSLLHPKYATYMASRMAGVVATFGTTSMPTAQTIMNLQGNFGSNNWNGSSATHMSLARTLDCSQPTQGHRVHEDLYRDFWRFASSRANAVFDGIDIWTYIANQYNQQMFVQTWALSNFRMYSVPNIANVESIRLPIQFAPRTPNTDSNTFNSKNNDHSKLAYNMYPNTDPATMFALGNNMFCVGDSNRHNKQGYRGGGALCFQSPELVYQFNRFVYKYSQYNFQVVVEPDEDQFYTNGDTVFKLGNDQHKIYTAQIAGQLQSRDRPEDLKKGINGVFYASPVLFDLRIDHLTVVWPNPMYVEIKDVFRAVPPAPITYASKIPRSIHVTTGPGVIANLEYSAIRTHIDTEVSLCTVSYTRTILCPSNNYNKACCHVDYALTSVDACTTYSLTPTQVTPGVYTYPATPVPAANLAQARYRPPPIAQQCSILSLVKRGTLAASTTPNNPIVMGIPHITPNVRLPLTASLKTGTEMQNAQYPDRVWNAYHHDILSVFFVAFDPLAATICRDSADIRTKGCVSAKDAIVSETPMTIDPNHPAVAFPPLPDLANPHVIADRGFELDTNDAGIRIITATTTLRTHVNLGTPWPATFHFQILVSNLGPGETYFQTPYIVIPAYRYVLEDLSYLVHLQAAHRLRGTTSRMVFGNHATTPHNWANGILFAVSKKVANVVGHTLAVTTFDALSVFGAPIGDISLYTGTDPFMANAAAAWDWMDPAKTTTPIPWAELQSIALALDRFDNFNSLLDIYKNLPPALRTQDKLNILQAHQLATLPPLKIGTASRSGLSFRSFFKGLQDSTPNLPAISDRLEQLFDNPTNFDSQELLGLTTTQTLQLDQSLGRWATHEGTNQAIQVLLRDPSLETHSQEIQYLKDISPSHIDLCYQKQSANSYLIAVCTPMTLVTMTKLLDLLLLAPSTIPGAKVSNELNIYYAPTPVTYRGSLTSPAPSALAIATYNSRLCDIRLVSNTEMLDGSLVGNICKRAGPIITSTSRHSGPAIGGYSLVLTGVNFDSTTVANGVFIGGHACLTPTLLSPTSINCIVPPGVGANLGITFEPVESKRPQFYFSFDRPTITSITPATIDKLGQEITVSGSNFGTDPQMITVSIKNAFCTPIIIKSDSKITCQAPADSSPFRIVRVNVADQTVSFSVQNHVNAPKAIVLSASHTQVQPGDILNIYGTNLETYDTSLANANILVNGRPFAIDFANDNMLQLVVPHGVSSFGPLSVRLNGVAATTPIQLGYQAPYANEISMTIGPNTTDRVPTTGSFVRVVGGGGWGTSRWLVDYTSFQSSNSSGIQCDNFNTFLECRVPPGIGAYQPFVVSVAGQHSNVMSISYQKPSISSIIVDDDILSIFGQNFVPTGVAIDPTESYINLAKYSTTIRLTNCQFPSTILIVCPGISNVRDTNYVSVVVGNQHSNQFALTATVYGVVSLQDNHAPIANALVTLYNAGNTLIATVKTNLAGEYSFGETIGTAFTISIALPEHPNLFAPISTFILAPSTSVIVQNIVVSKKSIFGCMVSVAFTNANSPRLTVQYGGYDLSVYGSCAPGGSCQNPVSNTQVPNGCKVSYASDIMTIDYSSQLTITLFTDTNFNGLQDSGELFTDQSATLQLVYLGLDPTGKTFVNLEALGTKTQSVPLGSIAVKTTLSAGANYFVPLATTTITISTLNNNMAIGLVPISPQGCQGYLQSNSVQLNIQFGTFDLANFGWCPSTSSCLHPITSHWLPDGCTLSITNTMITVSNLYTVTLFAYMDPTLQGLPTATPATSQSLHLQVTDSVTLVPTTYNVGATGYFVFYVKPNNPVTLLIKSDDASLFAITNNLALTATSATTSLSVGIFRWTSTYKPVTFYSSPTFTSSSLTLPLGIFGKTILNNLGWVSKLRSFDSASPNLQVILFATDSATSPTTSSNVGKIGNIQQATERIEIFDLDMLNKLSNLECDTSSVMFNNQYPSPTPLFTNIDNSLLIHDCIDSSTIMTCQVTPSPVVTNVKISWNGQDSSKTLVMKATSVKLTVNAYGDTNGNNVFDLSELAISNVKAMINNVEVAMTFNNGLYTLTPSLVQGMLYDFTFVAPQGYIFPVSNFKITPDSCTLKINIAAITTTSCTGTLQAGTTVYNVGSGVFSLASYGWCSKPSASCTTPISNVQLPTTGCGYTLTDTTLWIYATLPVSLNLYLDNAIEGLPTSTPVQYNMITLSATYGPNMVFTPSAVQPSIAFPVGWCALSWSSKQSQYTAIINNMAVQIQASTPTLKVGFYTPTNRPAYPPVLLFQDQAFAGEYLQLPIGKYNHITLQNLNWVSKVESFKAPPSTRVYFSSQDSVANVYTNLPTTGNVTKVTMLTNLQIDICDANMFSEFTAKPIYVGGQYLSLQTNYPGPTPMVTTDAHVSYLKCVPDNPQNTSMTCLFPTVASTTTIGTVQLFWKGLKVYHKYTVQYTTWVQNLCRITGFIYSDTNANNKMDAGETLIDTGSIGFYEGDNYLMTAGIISQLGNTFLLSSGVNPNIQYNLEIVYSPDSIIVPQGRFVVPMLTLANNYTFDVGISAVLKSPNGCVGKLSTNSTSYLVVQSGSTPLRQYGYCDPTNDASCTTPKLTSNNFPSYCSVVFDKSIVQVSYNGLLAISPFIDSNLNGKWDTGEVTPGLGYKATITFLDKSPLPTTIAGGATTGSIRIPLATTFTLDVVIDSTQNVVTVMVNKCQYSYTTSGQTLYLPLVPKGTTLTTLYDKRDLQGASLTLPAGYYSHKFLASVGSCNFNDRIISYRNPTSTIISTYVDDVSPDARNITFDYTGPAGLVNLDSQFASQLEITPILVSTIEPSGIRLKISNTPFVYVYPSFVSNQGESLSCTITMVNAQLFAPKTQTNINIPISSTYSCSISTLNTGFLTMTVNNHVTAIPIPVPEIHSS